MSMWSAASDQDYIGKDARNDRWYAIPNTDQRYYNYRYIASVEPLGTAHVTD
jgi:hypothetical protein